MSLEKICIEYKFGTFDLRLARDELNASGQISVMPVFEPPYLTRVPRFNSEGMPQTYMCGVIVAIVKEVIIKQKSRYSLKATYRW